ncbi:GNAT family N-acetyltransferase [Pseudoxanthomonas winnipegensis]|uniref:GNAT family N-acetyltransferase n=1 Tax=Pseudoxanthomonas winnipegensis TaxID=2480810 RepID=UPI002575DE49|nr:GNAT family N-acetyltransferase [Pseudoxanthomonas winnipegensis]WJI16334.1 GNAT family N-acetyltransferase [Pseudoxanthomonas winnipegensis]
MRIAPLCHHRQHLDELARTHVQAFGALLPEWTFEQARDELATHVAPDAIPNTWLALDGADWLGSVSLLAEDDPRLAAYTPWLASLYVRPAARARGVGAALVRHCVAAAAALGVARLHLYCEPARVPYYARLGWTRLDHLPLGAMQVVVMTIEPGSPHV